jgi:hypothetical protein
MSQFSPEIWSSCVGIRNVVTRILVDWKNLRGVLVNISRTSHRVFKKTLQYYSKCYCVARATKAFTLKGVQTTQHSSCWMMDSLYAFKCKRFRSTLHTGSFGTPLQISFWNTLHYQLKLCRDAVIPGRTRCNLLHYESSKRCTCLLNKSI